MTWADGSPTSGGKLLGMGDKTIRFGQDWTAGGKELEVRGSGSYKLAIKMKEVKQKLKVWNREVFGKLETNKSLALQQVEFWDREESGRILTVEETELKKEAKDNYRKWVIMEETHWRQLSREIWLKEGDRNTGFFHRMASAHRRNNHLERIKINGEWLLEEQEIREGIASTFQKFAFRRYGWKADIGGLRRVGLRTLEISDRISLLGGLYKLLAKVLANRLKKVVGKVVSTSQNAFVKGRQILDASLVANEVIDKWQRQKEKGIICKLDIEKAYDCINWNVGEWSACRRAVEGGFLSGCNIRGGSGPSLNISHLFFADDTIIFCEARKDHLTYLGWILFWFEAASGLKINLAKSEIIPVGAPNRAPYIWDGVEERVRRRLALWKRQYISKGGRVTLIKSTLASMRIYQMSIFRMPKVVVRRIEKVQKDFLWGGGNTERKVHLVKWEVVCTDKEKGGLGLRKLALLNKALLGKWIWRPKKGNGAVDVGVWKEIWKESDWCWDNITFRVGKGNLICFWTDVWCSESSLAQCFPHLFGMAAHQSLTVEEMWDQNSGQGNWNLHFLRDFNDGRLSWLGSSSTF
ncbi:putative ribonuclease H protein [Vitis vinifera]|uniref:Putative ribonuclease H protein n=1 Tax=Vitis vinifera TaxID=29760 RepID=A0A438DD13_VITVI|nr:putative ribonuclease H protein [Vitis vinifera]